MRSWGVAFVLAYPAILIVAPIARRLALRFVESPFAPPHGPGLKFAPAIWAGAVEWPVHAVVAEGAFERTDEGARLVGRQVAVAAFAARAHLEHIGSPPLAEA